MTQYKLTEEWLPKPENQPFNIIDIDINNVYNYQNDIKWLINSFHKRYEWDGFPSWGEVIVRLETGKNFFFLCEYNKKIIGWVWFKKGEVDINKEHIKFYAKTNEQTAWGYNNFLVSSKLVDRPANAGFFWCNLHLRRLFDLGIKDILIDVESWQDVSLKMCDMNGMQKIDWINELVKNS